MRGYMTPSPLYRSVDRHLGRIGSDLESFIRAGIAKGASAEVLAAELVRVTEIHVAARTLYRWMDEMGIERPDLRKAASL